MATTTQTMEPASKPKTEVAAKVAPIEKELRVAYAKRGNLIVEQVARQARNLEKLQKSNKAAGSDAQQAAIRTAVESLAKRLIAAARNEAATPVGGIPEE